ncbi:I78 family peptidase inhibitor [Lysobacter sp. A3-1-A15]
MNTASDSPDREGSNHSDDPAGSASAGDAAGQQDGHDSDTSPTTGTMPAQRSEAQRAEAPPMSDPLPPLERTCNADAAAGHVGHEATPGMVEAARRDAGAATARVLKPGQMVTMEFIEGRLNIDVDANNIITGVRCG